MLVNLWYEWERQLGKDGSEAHVAKLLPDKIKKRRRLVTEDGTEAGWEEYFEYVFPDEKAVKPNLKILELAHQWKKQKIETTDNKN